MRIETRNVQIKFSSRLDRIHQDVCLAACSPPPPHSGCRTPNQRRQTPSEFNQPWSTSCELMDERNGNRRDVCTEVALSGMGRTQRQARRHCAFSGDQIFLFVRLFSTNFPSSQPGKTKLDFLKGSCKSSAPREYVGIYTRVLIGMKTQFASDTCARDCVQPSYFSLHCFSRAHS